MTEIRVVCAIIEKDGKILAAQRSLKMSLPLHWEFPGGKVEKHETDETALLRELEEELNISVRIHKRLNSSSYSDGEKLIQLIPFTCEICDGEPRSNEHKAIVWCDYEDCLNLNWCPADIPIVDEYWQRTP